MKLTRTIGIGAAVALTLALTAPAADAAYVNDSEMDGVTMFFVSADPGETLNLTVAQTGAGLEFADPDTNLIATGPCTGDTPHHVVCPVPATASVVGVHGQAGNDHVTLSLTPGGAFYLKSNSINSLYGWEGDDVLIGSDADDQLIGGPGTDQLVGNDGKDQIDGGDGADSIDAGAGNDVITGGNGDSISCGDGYDYLTAPVSLSATLTPAAGCESVTRPWDDTTSTPPPAPATPPAAAPVPAPAPTAAPSAPVASKVRGALTLKKGVVSVQLDCPATGSDCVGELRLLSGRTIVGKGRIALDNGDRKAGVKVKLSTAGKKLARKKTLKLTLAAIVAGKQTTLGSVTVKTG